ncbi:MAG: tetratricopeptide repeat protein [Gemmatimonadota bacterium]|nr:tetratricopeptide repeat protein [Gemmatimonadota bacterium]MDE2985828.1 tetratricopeptide repeat protein [Gemmatimonadota bacterium]
METPQDRPPPSPRVSLARDLIHRRVPHILAIYAGASWALVEFTAFATDEFLLSPLWTRLVLLTLLLLLPSVLMLAWFHGKPGRDRDSLARTEKIGIPANAVLCAIVLWALFGGEDLGSATTSVMAVTEEGDTIRREVPKAEFRKRTALFPLEPGPGLGDDESWTAYAIPLAIEYDLMPDDYFVPVTFRALVWPSTELGYPDMRGIPLLLKREVARRYYAGFMTVGEIDRVQDRYRVTLAVHEVESGNVVGDSVFEGSDLLALADSISGLVKRALRIPEREDVRDSPVRQLLTEDDAALAEFVKGLMEGTGVIRGSTEHLEAAVTLDPTFTAAHRALSWRLWSVGRNGEALASIEAAIAYLSRLPERARFQVRAEYYGMTGERDKVREIVDMWLELHPEDVDALLQQWEVRLGEGDPKGALATLAEIFRLNPGHGEILARMARSHERLGQHDSAAAAFAEYMERFPDEEGGYVRLAEFQQRRGDYEQERTHLEKGLLLHPLSMALALNLADLDRRTGRFDEARAGYERAFDRAPAPDWKAEALTRMKCYHHFRGEMDDAVRAATAWLAEASAFMDPESIAHRRFGDLFVYLDAGRFDEAADFVEDLKGLTDPWVSGNLAPRADVHLALATGGVETAREKHGEWVRLLEANELGDLRSTVIAVLGAIRERAGDHAGALESYRSTIALGPNVDDPCGWNVTRGKPHLSAGRVLRKMGRLDEAEAELRESLRYVPSLPGGHLELALVLEARGDTAGAVEHLESALAAWENADGDFEPAREARAKLAELGGG